MGDSGTLSPLKTARRDKIVEAAHQEFVQTGFRATTMEAIAVAAGMSKVTLYGYFADKDAVFAAVAMRLAVKLKTAVQAELDRHGPVADRIAAALATKQEIVFAEVRSSAFSGELFFAKDLAARDMFRWLDAGIEAAIRVVLLNAGWADHDASEHAQIVFAAAQGIGNRAATSIQAQRQIGLVVAALLDA